MFWREFSDETNTCRCTSISKDLLKICRNMLEKIGGGGQGKQIYPIRKCRAFKKKGEMC
jgi:hypothetical protein